MRWYLFFMLAMLLIATYGCTHLSAAPASTLPPPEEITTEALLEYTIVSRDGTRIGTIDGVIISTQTGDTQYVIVFIKDIYNFGKGAIYSPQDHYLPIPWSQFELDASHRQLIVNAESDFINDAPLFTDPPDTTVAGWDSAILLYWTE